jgi:hypothetical protein
VSVPSRNLVTLATTGIQTDSRVGFDQYARAGLTTSHPIPEDQIVWDTFLAGKDRNRAVSCDLEGKVNVCRFQEPATLGVRMTTRGAFPLLAPSLKL